MNLTNALSEVERAAGAAWNVAALAAIQTIARRQSKLTADDVLETFPTSPTCSRRAWGPVWLRARRLGFIEPTGEIHVNQLPAKINPNSHPGASFRVYRSLICEV